MSRTDKTNPYWLKIARGDHGCPTEDWHRCHRSGWRFSFKWYGPCELRTPLPPTRDHEHWMGCEVWVSAYSRMGRKLWGNRPDKATRKEMGFEGRNRMLLRQLRLRWKSEPLEDIDSTENAPRNKRHSHNRWLWD